MALGLSPKKLQSLHNWTKSVFEAEWISGCYQLIGLELPAQESVKPSMTNTTWNYRLVNVLTCNRNLPDHLWCGADTISLREWLCLFIKTYRAFILGKNATNLLPTSKLHALYIHEDVLWKSLFVVNSRDGVPPYRYHKQHRREMHESAKANGRLLLPHIPVSYLWVIFLPHCLPVLFSLTLCLCLICRRSTIGDVHILAPLWCSTRDGV